MAKNRLGFISRSHLDDLCVKACLLLWQLWVQFHLLLLQQARQRLVGLGHLVPLGWRAYPQRRRHLSSITFAVHLWSSHLRGALPKQHHLTHLSLSSNCQITSSDFISEVLLHPQRRHLPAQPQDAASVLHLLGSPGTDIQSSALEVFHSLAPKSSRSPFGQDMLTSRCQSYISVPAISRNANQRFWLWFRMPAR